jgi:hypothetical protein
MYRSVFRCVLSLRYVAFIPRSEIAHTPKTVELGNQQLHLAASQKFCVHKTGINTAGGPVDNM